MRYLPPIAADGDEICLPLSDNTTLRLTDAILTEAEASRLELLRDAVCDDPALALWCVCFAWYGEQSEIKIIDDAALWLNHTGMAHLEGSSTAADKGHSERWAGCVGESIARRLTAQASLDGESPESSEEVLAVMISNFGQWRSAATSGSPGALRGMAPPQLEAAIESDDRTKYAPSEEARLAASQIVTQWQAEHPCAWEILQKAFVLRRRVDRSEQDWDDHFLREKLASLKEFTYGASHELNNPLFNISSRAQVLLRDEEDPERRRKLSTIYAHAMRASEMINDIALAARPPTPEISEVDIVAAAHQVIGELTGTAKEQATTLRILSDATEHVIDADAVQLAVAIREMCINALESLKRSTRRGEITVSIEARETDAVEITVSDNGLGLDQRARRHLFDPFFSGYESGRGLGFGLTKCWQIVHAHGGTIVIDSRPDRGAALTICLPVKQPQSVAKSES